METKHTSTPWRPGTIVANDGSKAVMAGEGNESVRICSVDHLTDVPERSRHIEPCPHRDANLEHIVLIDALESAGYEPRPYSGRGMYGKDCVAVSGQFISPFKVGQDIGEGFGAPREDSLGKGIVLYWPSYKWPEGDE